MTFPILTRIFSVEDYGNLALANATMIIVIALAKCGITTSFIRHYPEYSSQTEKEYLYSSSLFGITSLSLCVIIIYLYALFIFRGLISADLLKVLLIVGALILLKNLYNLYATWLRAEEKVIELSWLGFLSKAATSFGGILTCVIWIKGVYGFFIGMLAVQAVAILFITVYFCRRRLLKIGKISLSILKKLYFYGYPLIFYEVSSMINDYSDRFLIKFFLGSTQVGLYSVGYNLAMYAQALITAPLWMAIFPIYTKMWEEDGEEKTKAFLSTLLKYYSCIAILVIFGMSLTSDCLVNVLASSKYAAASKIVPLVITSVMVYGTYHITGASFFLLKQTKRIALYTITAAAMNVVLNLYLIPKYGILGAAYATVASYGALAVSITLYSNKHLKLKWPYKDILFYLAFAALMATVMYNIRFESDLLNLFAKSFSGFVIFIICILLYDASIRKIFLSIPMRVKSSRLFLKFINGRMRS